MSLAMLILQSRGEHVHNAKRFYISINKVKNVSLVIINKIIVMLAQKMLASNVFLVLNQIVLQDYVLKYLKLTKKNVSKTVNHVNQLEYALNAQKLFISNNNKSKNVKFVKINYFIFILALNVILDINQICLEHHVIQYLKMMNKMKYNVLKIVNNVIKLEYALNVKKVIIYINKINNVYFVL
ncbi:hypothetical protein IMG5_042980 [Ichthyophthirius multifiliis]|uniref:Uncharacterized protein n=1 Tax=Ichthyophthirius multifiliis TaxID=5932 RepID=G0QM37_ICHMU|nr:hypothetical protein IMG5_042980 [Ichthyophthirius multifiliis]EGR33718.1 hypothetical protein IMG5_042980 [Ichthyophthirius multifiliis]|eukprot:XP_004037704.1 hypothetical protein IMG5_042980 [Ichthyophthirius multifiliis]